MLVGCAGCVRKVAGTLVKLPGAGDRQVAQGGPNPPRSETERVQVRVGTGGGLVPVKSLCVQPGPQRESRLSKNTALGWGSARVRVGLSPAELGLCEW